MEGQQQAMEEGRGAGDAPQLNFMIAESFKYAIPVLLGLIEVNNIGKDKSPFETHPVQMWVFVFSSFIYFSAAQRSVPMAITSGSLSSVSQLSVLLPRLLGALIFIPWAIVAYQIHAVLIRDACRQLRHKINTIISTSIEQIRDACRQLRHKINTIISTSIEQLRDACRQLHHKINTIISTSIEQIRDACRQLRHKINTFVPLILAYQIHDVSIRDACRRLHDKINTYISSFSSTTSIQQQELPV